MTLLRAAPCLGLPLTALLGNLTGHPALAALGRTLQPMSTPAAAAFLDLGAGLLLVELGRRSRAARWAALGAAVLATAYLGLGVLLFHFQGALPLFGLLGGAVSVGLLAMAGAGRGGLRQGAALAALLPLVAGALHLFGYASGVPLDYESGFMPASLPTSLCLACLGLALLPQAGHDTFPLSLFRLHRTERNPALPWAPQFPLAAFLLGATLALVAGVLVMRSQVDASLASARSQLAGYADLKAEGLDRWVAERRADAALIRETPLIKAPLQAFLRSQRSGDPGLAAWMVSLRKAGGYRSITLCDTAGRVRLHLGPPEAPEGSAVHDAAFRQVLATGDVALEGFHAQGADPDPHSGWWVPVTGPDGARVGALCLATDSGAFLGPYLADLSPQAPRAVSSLVDLSGADARILGQPVPPGLRKAVLAAAATAGPVDTTGGGGRPSGRTFVSARPIRDTPWHLVVRAEEAAVVAALRPRFWAIALVTLGAVAVTGLGTGILVRHYAARRVRELLAAERERKVLAERARSLMHEANDIILITDQEGRILEANRVAEAAYGYDQNDLRGLAAGTLRPPGTEAEFRERWAQLLAQGQGVWETRHRRRDGSTFPVEASSRVVAQEGETRVVSFLRDISERHAQARAIRRLSRLYAALGQVGQAIVWARSQDALLRRICEVLVEGGGMASAWAARLDAVGTGLEVAVRCGADGPPLPEGVLAAVVARGEPVILAGTSAVLPVAQAGRITHLLGVDAGEGGTFGPEETDLLIETAMDLAFALDKLDGEAQRARAEAEQRNLEAQLQQSQKMESLGSLAGGVAHDLNNVLGAILSLASAHQETPGLTPALGRALETIVKACLRGRDVIKSLLYFSRKGLEAPRPLDLNALVRDLAQLLAHTTLQRVRLDLALEEGLPALMGDGSALSHAVMNLCVNAVDAMPGGGTLTLSTRREGGGVVLEVADTGEGMPEEVLRKAMEPFFTTKPLGKGTGLGLAMVFGTMKAHGGTLELQSRPGEGTSARLCFPESRLVADGADAGPAQEGGAPTGRPRRVLLVDDDDLVREAMEPLLKALGHTVHLAPGGREALALLEEGLAPDIVILDMNMPGLTGAQVLPLLLAAQPGLRVILASGHSDRDLPDVAQGKPGVSFLRKPFSVAELRAALA
ncbi:ATP-binding protein [Mesoterricola sediminis]|uniref:ATP-binding protein n=1 Tax=Mesoterricola sediminis TaxID=2927980 RepID=UPI00292D7CF8|nr:ATP-binding protein [Mesoterricola sediminis]